MSNAPKFRKKAVEYEQLKQFDRAVASYVRAIEENESTGEEVDVALFNKVGDLTLRQGRVTEAVTYYERAVEHYASNGLFDNAIALCNKILRNAPGRSNVYFTLGRICGRKGLRSDATRNFLEYATRMQQEGRVDEGMRALAEVADLMPELTEVGRMVEEHAARAGITLPQRRRATPAGTPAQPIVNAAGNSFGLSKDLVFLDIEYDGPRQTPGKTPAPMRAVDGIKPAAVRTPTPRVVTPVIDPTPTPIAVQPTTDGDSAAATTGVVAKTDSAIAEIDLPELLDDAQDFTSAVEESEIPDVTETAVVDGKSILKPFVDPATPLPLIAGLVPTEFAGTPRYTTAVQTQATLPELLQRGVTPKSDVVANLELPEIVTQLPTAAHFDTITGDGRLAPSAVGANVTDGLLAIGEQAQELHAAYDVVPVDMPIAALDDAAVVVPADAELPGSNVVTPGEHTDKVLAVPDAELSETLAVETPRVDSSELVIEYDVPDAATELAEQLLGIPFDTLPAESSMPLQAGAIALTFLDPVVQEITAIAGFTAEEHLHTTSAHDASEVDFLVSSTSVGVAPAADLIDFDAPLEELANAITPLAGVEFEEFAPANDELAATRFVRVESEELPSLNDVFESSDELSPLIFPLPFESEPFNAPEPPSPNDDAFFAPEEPEAEDNYELRPFELPDTTELQMPDTFDRELIEPGSGEASQNDFEETLDASYDETYDPAVELPFIASDRAFIGDATFGPDDTSDLNELFADAEIPTAVAAAEATVVATTRRGELQSAVRCEPENWILRRRLAEALFEAGERDAAIAELTVALVGFEGLQEFARASEIADELVRVAGDRASHHHKRVELAIRLGDQNRLREAYLDLADTLVRGNDDLRARAVYARVLEIDPWDDRARTALGDAAPPAPPKVVAGSDDAHIDLAEWLRDDDEPQSTRLRMREPEASGNEQDDFDSLLRQFKQGVARSLGEDDHDSHYDLGVAYKEMGLLDDAVGEFQKALRSRNNRLAAYEALGQCFLEQQNYKVAVTVLTRALHEPAIRDEQRVGVLYLLGYSCEALQRFDEARSYFQRVYAIDILFRDVAQRLADLERITR